jgi:hypothetical protein
MQVMQGLTKGERRLHAYLNQDKPPLGFKGNPMGSNGQQIARNLTHFHLSRHLYIRRILERGLFSLAEQLDVAPGKKIVLSEIRPGEKISKEEILENKDIYSLIASAKQHGFRMTSKEVTELIENASDEIWGRVNQFYELMLMIYSQELEIVPLKVELCGLQDDFIEKARKYGYLHMAYNELTYIAEETVGKQDLTEADYKALRLLIAVLYSKRLLCVNDEDKGCNEFGRTIFTRRQNTTWQFLQNRMFDKFSARMLINAARNSGATDEKLESLFETHMQFAFREQLSIGGNSFLAIGSPFAQKPIGSPIGNFEIAVYPTDEKLRSAMHSIRDQKYEHADGAIALAACTILENEVLLEEIQSDVPELLRRAVVKPDALSGIELIWPQLSLEAVRILAKMKSFTEIYAATPWRIYTRYTEAVHPEKTRIYFDTMEKLGGQLAYDDTASLDRWPQYYFRFEA